MSAADDKVTQLPLPLERIGRRIDTAWQRIQKGEAEWVGGSLELAQALAEGRERFKADHAFGQWLKENEHDHVNHNDRAALINLASDPELAREVLTKTERRSYQYIWKENESRFPHVSKPRKKKTTRHPPKTPPDVKQAAGSAYLDGSKTQKEIAQELGLGSEQVVKTSASYEHGRRDMLAELLDAAAAKNFSEKGALRIEDAIRIHTARLNKQFEQRVNDEVRRRIDAANDAAREQNKKLRQEVMTLQRIIGQYAVFTKTQFRQMQMLCHPDSSASEQTKAELSQILVENERRLVKPEKQLKDK